MNEGKKLFSLADFLILLGVVVLLGGLYLFDWRLVVVVVGLLLVVVGVARLKRTG